MLLKRHRYTKIVDLQFQIATSKAQGTISHRKELELPNVY